MIDTDNGSVVALNMSRMETQSCPVEQNRESRRSCRLGGAEGRGRQGSSSERALPFPARCLARPSMSSICLTNITRLGYFYVQGITRQQKDTMLSRSDFTVLTQIAEAAALSDAAERDFERVSRRIVGGTLVEVQRARGRLFNARIQLSDQLRLREAKAVATCYCKGRLWVCKKHPAVALDQCRCGESAVPCACNPNRSPPPGYSRPGRSSQSWNWPRSIRSNSRRGSR